MPPFSYKTIEFEADGLYKEKGSKFLAFAFPVSNEAEVKAHLDSLRKKYFDARHHCYAYRLGPSGQTFRANDDGEPNHSAGDPILGQLRAKDLTNVLIVVVRYFGGVKLGVGGLISAYRAAAEDVLAKSTIIEKEITSHVTLQFDYPATPEVMRLVSDFSMTIVQQRFEERCELKLEYPARLEGQVMSKIQLLVALKKVLSTL
ncbi:MAG TPA: YigZ family protein [Chryseosolibacter sp.]